AFPRRPHKLGFGGVPKGLKNFSTEQLLINPLSKQEQSQPVLTGRNSPVAQILHQSGVFISQIGLVHCMLLLSHFFIHWAERHIRPVQDCRGNECILP
ncbi:MAG: hypothetical protein L6R28_14875, partial [Planctomycetes bacterium]|nr:hypothetical protein [Planctomycetota bacterium]